MVDLKRKKRIKLVQTTMYLFDNEKNNMSELNEKKEYLCELPTLKKVYL